MTNKLFYGDKIVLTGPDATCGTVAGAWPGDQRPWRAEDAA